MMIHRRQCVNFAAVALTVASLIASGTETRAAEEHTLELRPTNMLGVWQADPASPGCQRISPYGDREWSGSVQVGFHNVYLPGAGDSCTNVGYIYEGAVKFDLSPLRQYGGPVVTRAELAYGVMTLRVSEADGGASSASFCAHHLGVASEDWTGGWGGLIPHDDAALAFYTGNAWALTYWAERWLAIPDDNHGVVLKGDYETYQRNNAACVASLDDFRLVVTFVGQAPPPTPTLSEAARAARDADRLGDLARLVPTPTLPAAARVPPDVDIPIGEGEVTSDGEPAPSTDPLRQSPRDAELAGPAISDRLSTTATPTPQPRLGRPDLRIASVEIVGRQPNGRSDCDPGDNRINATIRNAGESLAAPSFARLEVDGNERGIVQVPPLGPSQAAVVSFQVLLDRGQHTLKITVDADNKVIETDEGETNNIWEDRVNCVAEG